MHAIGRMTSMERMIREAVPYFQEAEQILRMHFELRPVLVAESC
jgi:hypothetical protein